MNGFSFTIYFTHVSGQTFECHHLQKKTPLWSGSFDEQNPVCSRNSLWCLVKDGEFKFTHYTLSHNHGSVKWLYLKGNPSLPKSSSHTFSGGVKGAPKGLLLRRCLGVHSYLLKRCLEDSGNDPIGGTPFFTSMILGRREPPPRS